MNRALSTVGRAALLFSTSTLVAAIALPGCAADESEEGTIESEVRVDARSRTVDANDVALLFPLAAGNREVYPSLSLADETLLPASAFDSVIAFATRKGFDPNDANITFEHSLAAANRAQWRIVAARIDPCGESIVPSAVRTCQVQLRLVAQPFGNNASGAQDASFHLVYVLGTDKPVAGSQIPVYPKEAYQRMADELFAIQEASSSVGARTAGVPLGAHPGLLAESQKGGARVADAVRTFIRNRVAESKARAITMMGLRSNDKNAPDFWVFFGGALMPGASGWSFAPIPIPTFKRSRVLVEGFNVLTNNFLPVSGPEHEVHAGNLLSTKRFVTSTRESHQIDNPTLFDINTQDCVSCHTATRQGVIHRARVAEDFTFRYVPPAGVTAYVQCKNLPGTGMKECEREALNPATRTEPRWNFRAFGYFHEKPTVALRTANEVAVVVEKMNRSMFGASKAGPGPDCAEADRNGAVFKCFVGLTGKESADKCLAMCRR